MPSLAKSVGPLDARIAYVAADSKSGDIVPNVVRELCDEFGPKRVLSWIVDGMSWQGSRNPPGDAVKVSEAAFGLGGLAHRKDL